MSIHLKLILISKNTEIERKMEVGRWKMEVGSWKLDDEFIF
jgi:hypothetical protein